MIVPGPGVTVGPRPRKIIQPANMRPIGGRGPMCAVNLRRERRKKEVEEEEERRNQLTHDGGLVIASRPEGESWCVGQVGDRHFPESAD